MLTLFLLLASSATPDSAFDRCEALFREHPVFSADVTVNDTDRGTIQIRRPDQFRFEIHRNLYKYVLVRAGQSAVEYAQADRVFADAPVGPLLVQVDSQISSLPELDLPRVLLLGQARGFFKGLSVTSSSADGSTKVVGVSTQNKENVVKITIDGKGQVSYFETRSLTQMGLIVVTMKFSPYRFSAAGPFSLVPPLGFSAFELPRGQYPWQVGMKTAFGSGLNPDGGEIHLDEVLSKTPTALVVLLDSKEGPSQRAATHIPELVAALKGKAKLFVLSEAPMHIPSGDSVKLVRQAPTSHWEEAEAAGTPIYYLIRGGKIARLWLGDDDAKRPEMRKEMLNAIASEK